MRRCIQMDEKTKAELKERIVERMRPTRRWGFWAKFGMALILWIIFLISTIAALNPNIIEKDFKLINSVSIVTGVCAIGELLLFLITANDYTQEHQEAITFYNKVIGVKES